MVLWGKSKEMKKNAQLVQSEITKEAEAIEVVVTSTPVVLVDHDKCDHNNHSQSSATRNVDKDRDELSKYQEDNIDMLGGEVEKCSTKVSEIYFIKC